jgi:hypothetical protein
MADLQPTASPHGQPLEPGAEQRTRHTAPGVPVLDPHRLDQADTGAPVRPEQRVAGDVARRPPDGEIEVRVVERALPQSRLHLGAVAGDHRMRPVLVGPGHERVAVRERPCRRSVRRVEPGGLVLLGELDEAGARGLGIVQCLHLDRRVRQLGAPPAHELPRRRVRGTAEHVTPVARRPPPREHHRSDRVAAVQPEHGVVVGRMRVPGEPPLQVGGLPQPVDRVGEPLPLQQFGHQLQVRDPAHHPTLHAHTPTGPHQANFASTVRRRD